MRPGYQAVLEHGITSVEAGATEFIPLQEAMRKVSELVRAAAARATLRWSGLQG